MRVLIVDDTPTALAALEAALRGAGYDVQIASDGREALRAVMSGGCRLVVSDVEMPGMGGLEFCRTVREADLPGYVYIILLTGHDRPEEKVAGLSAGADDYVAKPFHPAELLARVRAGERVLSIESREMAIFAMAKLAESRDPETGAHLERVRGYSRILASRLAQAGRFPDEITRDFVRTIYLTSPLHDIGKVGIPDAVLLKPGRLSDREFEIMKTHTTLGAETLDAAVRMFPGAAFLRMARDIAATHHERYDGTGYPAGLKGDDIPLAGRIVAVADVYDALTSRRVYKAAYGHDIARSMIVSESGGHFDPVVIEAFIASEAAIEDVRSRYADERGAMAEAA